MEIIRFFRNLRLIKKIELIFPIISALTVVLSLIRFPFGDELLIISVGFYSIFYMIFGVFIYKYDKADIFGTKFSKVVLSFYACNGYGICLLGILFKLMIWPNEKEMMIVGFTTVLLNILIITVFWLIFRSVYLKSLLSTTILFFLIGSFFYFLPIDTIIDIRYRINPECGFIIKQSNNDPHNLKLRNQASECKNKWKNK